MVSKNIYVFLTIGKERDLNLQTLIAIMTTMPHRYAEETGNSNGSIQ